MGRGARGFAGAMDGPEAVKHESPADTDAHAAAPQQQEPAAEAAAPVKEEQAGEPLPEAPPPAAALEPEAAGGGMMLAADDGGLVGASGQRISAAEIQLVQNLVERCLQARGKRRRTLEGEPRGSKEAPRLACRAFPRRQRPTSANPGRRAVKRSTRRRRAASEPR